MDLKDVPGVLVLVILPFSVLALALSKVQGVGLFAGQPTRSDIFLQTLRPLWPVFAVLAVGLPLIALLIIWLGSPR
jgi:hypothetical protein